MSTRQLRVRVEKLHASIAPQSDGMITLVELCRLVWRSGKKQYLELANNGASMLHVLVPTFEREDASVQTSRTRRRKHS